MSRFIGLVSLGVLAVFCLSGCGGSESGGDGSTKERVYVTVGTAPVGGVFYTMGGALSEVLNQQASEENWRVTAESTGGSMENIRHLDSGDTQFAISNSSITYFAVRGEEGWDRAYQVKSVMTLFPNVAMFVTTKEGDVKQVGDLKGKRVSLGPQGAGFEYFIRPILLEHGLSYDDLDPVYCGQQTSVDYLGDGSIVAAFLGGGVPTGSITSAASTMNIFLVPYGEVEKRRLIEKYPFFGSAAIPADTYSGQTEEYQGMNVGSAHLITGASVSEDLVYQVTRIIYENRETVAEKHKAGRSIQPQNVVRDIGTEFHPGAIRYYREIGIWPESTSSGAAD